MNTGLLVFLVGLFGVPLLLLGYGHRLRRRTPRGRAVFWGALIGHCIAGCLAVTLGMIPPEAWTPDDRLRGFVGFWSLCVFPLAGALIGAVVPTRPAVAPSSTRAS
jgi:hypothetical protein